MMIFTKKNVLMDMLPDGWGVYSGGHPRISAVVEKKELSLIEQLKQIKEEEKPKEKSMTKFQFKL